MGKLKLNQKGFTAVELLLTLIFLAIVVAIGVYVWHNHNTNKPAATTSVNTAKTSTTANPYAGWKSYSDSFFTFKYPATWQVSAPGNEGFDTPSDASLIGSKSAIPSYFTSSGGVNINMNFSFFTSVSDPSGCNQEVTCTVQIVTPLTTKGLSNPKLVVFSETDSGCPAGATCGPNNLAQYEVLDTNSIGVGDTAPITDGVIVGGKTYQLIGCSLTVETNGVSGDPVCGTINNYQAFQASSDYKNLVNVLNSLTVN